MTRWKEIGEDEMIYIVLKRARHRVEQGWCQKHPAVDYQGRYIALESEYAQKWSLTGAIARAMVDEGLTYNPAAKKYFMFPWDKLVMACHDSLPVVNYIPEDGHIPKPLPSFEAFMNDWNDHPRMTKQGVLALLDRACEHAWAKHTGWADGYGSAVPNEEDDE